MQKSIFASWRIDKIRKILAAQHGAAPDLAFALRFASRFGQAGEHQRWAASFGQCLFSMIAVTSGSDRIGRADSMKPYNDLKVSKQWYHHPAVHVLFFFLILGLGAGTGIMAASPIAGLTTGVVVGIIASVAASKYWESREPVPASQMSNKDILEKLEVYVEGKMKRYTLLFGVNGGAFAIVQLLADQSKQLPGRLTLPSLAIGAIVFTTVMTVDIWMWGQLMRREGFAGELAFSLVGKAILLLIAGLIISGWVLAAMP